MDLLDEIQALRSKAESQRSALNGKRKTENALLLPFFSALGYDPFDVREVEPGFCVRLEEEGERQVDYALKKGGTPAMLFQCMEAGTELESFDPTPLFEYFGELEASIGALTNGLDYRFFADLPPEANADKRPFLEFNLLDCRPEEVQELRRLSKPAFDRGEVLAAAHELKYTRLLRGYFQRQWEGPDEHFVRFLAAQVHDGGVSEETVERLRSIVQRVLQQFTPGEEIRGKDAPGKGIPGDEIPGDGGVGSAALGNVKAGPQASGPEPAASTEGASGGEELPAEKRPDESPAGTRSRSETTSHHEESSTHEESSPQKGTSPGENGRPEGAEDRPQSGEEPEAEGAAQPEGENQPGGESPPYGKTEADEDGQPGSESAPEEDEASNIGKEFADQVLGG